MKKCVGKVSIEEKNEILKLYERINGLKELAKILTSENTELYEKLVNDLGETTCKFHDWWNEKSKKYEWESSDEGCWEIDFNTCEIFLVDEKE